MARSGARESLKIAVIGPATAVLAESTGSDGMAIVEAPGTRELLELLFAGVDAPDVAALLLEPESGLSDECRRQCLLLQLFGVRNVVLSNGEVDQDVSGFLSQAGFDTAIILAPANELETALLAALENLPADASGEELPFRLPLEVVHEGRVVSGRIESGTVRAGDSILFSPSNQSGIVKSIEAHDSGDVSLTLEQPMSLTPGELVSHQNNAPVESDVFKARFCWLGDEALAQGQRYTLKLNTSEAQVTLQSIERATGADGFFEVILRADTMLALDQFADLPNTGRFMLFDDGAIAGGGVLSMEGYADQRELITKRATNVQRVAHEITEAARELRNGHKGGVFWLTGLSGAGKSSVAVATEQRLFELGYQVYVLDGDNVRHGLNADLGFSPEERAENIRRIGEVAALMARAGMLVLTAFISPYRSDRDRARQAAGEHFREVHIAADLEVCERRDPKGLYKKARDGKIADFTGISAPYEAPENPELTVDTGTLDIEQSVDVIADYIAEHFAIT